MDREIPPKLELKKALQEVVNERLDETLGKLIEELGTVLRHHNPTPAGKEGIALLTAALETTRRSLAGKNG